MDIALVDSPRFSKGRLTCRLNSPGAPLLPLRSEKTSKRVTHYASKSEKTLGLSQVADGSLK